MLALTLLHLAANALLLSVGYYWLGVPESRATTLVWSLFLTLVLVFLGSSAYGASLAYFRQGNKRGIIQAWKTALRHLVPFAMALLVIVVLYAILAKWADYSGQPTFRIASWLTLKLRMPARPTSVARLFNTALWLVRWMVLPVLFLPMLSAIASSGWRGMTAKTRRYWIQTPILLYIAIRVPILLLHWIPRVHGFGFEAASFACRATIAYLLFGLAWLLLARITSGGTPRLTQPSTAASS